MADVLIEIENSLEGRDGHVYEARACGRERDDGLWEGWVEFVPRETGAAVVQTARETTQPNREDLNYWATGLTVAFLEGALDRALGVAYPDLRRRAVSGEPAFDRPRQPDARPLRTASPPPHAVLDPFAVYAEGDHVLRGQLDALDAGQLRNIIKAYDLSDHSAESIDALPRAQLRDLILAGVQRAQE